MEFTDVVRTWLYIDDILDWYSDFNTVRWEFFENRAIGKGKMPASTGIGVSNPAGNALVAACVAMRGAQREVRAEAVPSPLQCPASDYRSSFSRAAEIQLRDRRRLFVSGTASIAPHGETAHVGDVAGQISLTMEVVEAILASRGMSWRNVSRGIAYFKDLGDRPVFDSHCRAQGLSDLPVATTQGVICRDDLLFEIEVDAVA
jgi:enamine deaminase RidA (YjgF/YER057c/UK114 family)